MYFIEHVENFIKKYYKNLSINKIEWLKFMKDDYYISAILVVNDMNAGKIVTVNYNIYANKIYYEFYEKNNTIKEVISDGTIHSRRSTFYK